MECREIREMLAPYHDGELPPEGRARVEGHLRGCGECSSMLARLAEIDAGVSVPDPGPAYWEGFNRRVLGRLEKEGAAPAKVLRPRRGWARRGLPYFLPAVAAAALLLVVVRQTGVDPYSRTARAPSPAAPAPVERADRPAAPREKALPSPGAVPRGETKGKSVAEAFPEPVPAVVPRRQEAPPPPSPEAYREEADFAAPAATASREAVADAESAAGASLAGRVSMKSTAAAVPSPCGEARSLAVRGRLKEAESAQRRCLESETGPAAQESGRVFLAELLDRQSRFAEADAVLRETRRQFPESRPLDDYLRQRPEVQSRALPGAP